MKKTNAFLIGLCFLFIASHVAAEVKLPAVIGSISTDLASGAASCLVWHAHLAGNVTAA